MKARCPSGKVKYFDFKTASFKASEGRRDTGHKTISPYRCPTCNWFHIGHTPWKILCWRQFESKIQSIIEKKLGEHSSLNQELKKICARVHF